ncbi:MAG: iron-containing alcohol dehydrogenase [Clostridia bacterium]|nr:iron-containing alcohol dehydrogenase [Clostridia bacterium]MDE7328945.1 iron-containing alcohol dehydrogenase [Clostridia bacterium]
MNYNEFSNGTKIIDGDNSIAELSTVLVGLNASRVLVVVAERLSDGGFVDTIKNAIEKSGRLSVGAIYLGNEASDGEDMLKDLYFVYMSNNCDAIVVCGDGKLIDFSKALKLLVATQIKDVKKFYTVADIAREVIYIPFIAIPLEFGSGSETNSTAVVFDKEKGVSRNVTRGLLSPDYCIVDGELISGMDKAKTAYGVLEIFARAVDGYTVTSATPISIESLAKVYDDYIELQTSAISDGFCQVALTGLKPYALDLLEAPTTAKYVKMETRSAYLSKGTDSSGLGLIQCVAQAIADVKKIDYCKALPKAIKTVFSYNLDACKERYARCLLFFAGWQMYSDCPIENRHNKFVEIAEEFIDALREKYIGGEEIELNDEEKQAVLNAMAYNANVLNNPRKFNSIAFKSLL